MSNRPNLSLFQNAIVSWVTETNLLKDESGQIGSLPDVNEFFGVFKHKVQNNVITDFTLINLLHDFYPMFQTEDNNNLSPFEHIYVYALLLHFSCVESKDQFFQNATLNIDSSYQRAIYKFLSILTERQQFDKDSLSVIINEALMVGPVPPLKILPHIQTGTTPPTPKSTMLNNKTMKIRNLEAELMTERQKMEEMECQYQEKLRQKQKEIDETIAVNSDLQRELLEKESEMAAMSCDLEVDKACKVLMKQISEKTELILDYKETINTLNTENETLSEKFCASETRFAESLRKMAELEDTINSLSDELDRQSVKNSTLESHVTGLNSFIANSRRLDESLEAFNFFRDQDTNFNNNSIDNSLNTVMTEMSPVHKSPIIKKRAFSIDSRTSIPILRQRNRNFYRSTTYKDSKRYLSVADELLEIKDDGEGNETLSHFFDSLHEKRDSVSVVKFQETKQLEQVMEEETDISPTCTALLMELKKENEELRKVNESLALTQLANKRPKRGFKICVIS